MSFSGKVKTELLAQVDKARHCQLAELAAMLSGLGTISIQGGRIQVRFATEKELVAAKYQKLLTEATGIRTVVTQEKSVFLVDVIEDADVQQLFLQLKIMSGDGTLREQMTLTDGLLLQKSCCKRAFLRGAFLATGSMSDPQKSYHFEIVCENREKAEQLLELFASFDLKAKTVTRKNHEVVYLKEGSQIVDALNIMGAHVALMDLENVRIYKEMRNGINRRVNCETANINKTVHAAYRQQEAIRRLERQGILQELPQQLQEIARLRMEYPEATIQELGTLCVPEVGKSGVNHRLRKLEQIAEKGMEANEKITFYL